MAAIADHLVSGTDHIGEWHGPVVARQIQGDVAALGDDGAAAFNLVTEMTGRP
jgi:hypothetical protein